MNVHSSGRPYYHNAGPVVPMPWKDFVAEVLNLYRPGLRAPSTLKKMRRSLAMVNIATTADLTTDVIANLITSHPNWSPNTAWGILDCVRTAAAEAVRTGRLEISPFTLRPLDTICRKRRSLRKKHHSREDVRKVLNILAEDVTELRGWPLWYARRTQALVCVVAYTGARERSRPNACTPRTSIPRHTSSR